MTEKELKILRLFTTIMIIIVSFAIVVCAAFCKPKRTIQEQSISYSYNYCEINN